MTRQVSPNSVGSRRIVAALLAATDPLDNDEIAERAHLSRGTVRVYRTGLIAAGQIHIAAYRKSARGSPVPLFGPGPGFGQPPRKPAPLYESDAARCREYRRRGGRARKKLIRAQAAGKSMLVALLSL